ncbi:MAG: hypothetical protein AAF633_01175 [Chloroflexota bacterium]
MLDPPLEPLRFELLERLRLLDRLVERLDDRDLLLLDDDLRLLLLLAIRFT